MESLEGDEEAVETGVEGAGEEGQESVAEAGASGALGRGGKAGWEARAGGRGDGWGSAVVVGSEEEGTKSGRSAA